jgi:hypothetical protein
MSGRFFEKSRYLCVLPSQVDAQVRSRPSAMYWPQRVDPMLHNAAGTVPRCPTRGAVPDTASAPEHSICVATHVSRWRFNQGATERRLWIA